MEDKLILIDLNNSMSRKDVFGSQVKRDLESELQKLRVFVLEDY